MGSFYASGDEDFYPLQIWFRDLGRFDIGMRDFVAGETAFSTDSTGARHNFLRKDDSDQLPAKPRSPNIARLSLQGKKNKEVGDQGEERAVAHLRSNGFRIVARNVRYKVGEIDIVAMRGKELHFFEVRSRRSGGLVSPFETITRAKMTKIRRAAQCYLSDKKNNFDEKKLPACFFSVIGIAHSEHGLKIEMLLDAFV